MIVYVVLEKIAGDIVDFRGVFSTRELAEAYIEEQNKYYNFGILDVEEDVIDSH